MKRFLLIGLMLTVLLGIDTPSFAAQGFNQEQLSVTTAVGFTTAKITAANGTFATQAVCSVEGANIRWWTSATPTTSVGVLVSVGGSFIVSGSADIRNFKMIATSGTATISCQYSR